MTDSTAASKNSEQAFIEEIQRDFLEEMSFLLEQCEESYLKLENPQNRKEELDKIFRLAHSFKGAGAAVGFADLAHFAHTVEDCLTILRVLPDLVTSEIISLLLKAGDAFKVRVKTLKDKSSDQWDVQTLADEVRKTTQALGGSSANGHETKIEYAVDQTVVSSNRPMDQEKIYQSSAKSQSSSVKIDIERIDAVLDIVGELVVLKSQLMNEVQQYQSNLELTGLVALMEKSIRELQDKSLGIRMMPLKGLFLKTQRVIRDLSVKLEKPVEFEMSGDETEIDRTMVELLSDPLMHLARNALDHGIEKPESRVSCGKTQKGLIRLVAKQVGGRIVVIISDDGAGFSRERIAKKALEKGYIKSDRNVELISDNEIFQVVFAPGFSTVEVVSDVSGRGVGMDVVKTNIEKLKGTIEIESAFGKGTSFIISIPLTTSITEGMQVKSAGQSFVLPLDGIRELVDQNTNMVTQMHNGHEVINIRGKLLPVLNLDSLLRGQKTKKDKTVGDSSSKTIVVVKSKNGVIALRVQAIQGQVQVVLKSLGDFFSSSQGIAGAAILGDGKVALVLDVDNLQLEGIQAA